MAHLPSFLKGRGLGTSDKLLSEGWEEQVLQPERLFLSSFFLGCLYSPPPQLSLVSSSWSGQGSDAGVRELGVRGLEQNACVYVCERECVCACLTAGIWEGSRTGLRGPRGAGSLPGAERETGIRGHSGACRSTPSTPGSERAPRIGWR